MSLNHFFTSICSPYALTQHKLLCRQAHHMSLPCNPSWRDHKYHETTDSDASKADRWIINNTHIQPLHGYPVWRAWCRLLISPLFDHNGVTICDVRLGKVGETVSARHQIGTRVSLLWYNTHTWIMNRCTEQNLNVVTHFTVLMYHKPTGKCQHDLPVVASVLFLDISYTSIQALFLPLTYTHTKTHTHKHTHNLFQFAASVLGISLKNSPLIVCMGLWSM